MSPNCALHGSMPRRSSTPTKSRRVGRCGSTTRTVVPCSSASAVRVPSAAARSGVTKQSEISRRSAARPPMCGSGASRSRTSHSAVSRCRLCSAAACRSKQSERGSTSVESTVAPRAAATSEHSPVPAPISWTEMPSSCSELSSVASGVAAGQKHVDSPSWPPTSSRARRRFKIAVQDTGQGRLRVGGAGLGLIVHLQRVELSGWPVISPSAQPSPRRGLERVPNPPHRHAAWPRCCCCGGGCGCGCSCCGGGAGGAATQAECSAQLRVLLCRHGDETGRCEEHLARECLGDCGWAEGDRYSLRLTTTAARRTSCPCSRARSSPASRRSAERSHRAPASRLGVAGQRRRRCRGHAYARLTPTLMGHTEAAAPHTSASALRDVPMCPVEGRACAPSAASVVSRHIKYSSAA
eukprot:scaffold13160_cov81-Phaeocystis_antarctica.AAC.7